LDDRFSPQAISDWGSSESGTRACIARGSRRIAERLARMTSVRENPEPEIRIPLHRERRERASRVRFENIFSKSFFSIPTSARERVFMFTQSTT
jgi:hypothetical protein